MSCITDARELVSSFHTGREYIQQEDLTKAARKVGEAKKHESKQLFSLPSDPFSDSRYHSQTRCNSIDRHVPPYLSVYSLHSIVVIDDINVTLAAPVRVRATTLTRVKYYTKKRKKKKGGVPTAIKTKVLGVRR